MTTCVRVWTYASALFSIFAATAGATSVPGLSFEQLTDRSELVVTGQISRSWTDWDSDHKFIWTHYELSVSATHKGSAGSSVVLSEPGGVVGIQGMAVAGAVTYQPGERVLVFLERMPNGYLRTTGWSQGKFAIDSTGRLHGQSIGGVELVGSNTTSLRALNGMTVAQLHGRIATRLKSQGRAE